MAILVGQVMEARGLTDEARQYYEALLREDESDIVSPGTGIWRDHRPASGHALTVSPTRLAQAARKRLIGLHLVTQASSSTALTAKGKGSKAVPAGILSKETGIELLVEYLDTFYSDAEGWSQLAAAYAELGLYVSAPPC